MKRFLAVVLCLLLFAGCACAETDLSSLSYDELLALRSQVERELMARPEWKEVTVPGGTWIVGEDIPAGFYSITPTKGGGYLTIKDPNRAFSLISQGIRKDADAIGKVELKDGYIVTIDSGSLIFGPPVSLGF